MVVSVASTSDEWSTTLSPRQREVAFLVARGFANKEIARELGLSLGTTKLHVHNVFQKLGIRRRDMLICLASGLVVAEGATCQNWR
jgi:two-component system, NarL family, nitrate/nitrite response regulator NarL